VQQYANEGATESQNHMEIMKNSPKYMWKNCSGVILRYMETRQTDCSVHFINRPFQRRSSQSIA